MCRAASTPPDADADASSQPQQSTYWVSSIIGVHAVCQGRKDAPRNGRRGSLIDVRTWNAIIIIINMRQGNVMHTMHTGLVSPVKTKLLAGV